MSTTARIGLLSLFVAVLPQCLNEESAVERERFRVENLVANRSGVANHTDPNLINPWGLALGPGTGFWVANQGTSSATVYNAIGESQLGAPVVVPPPPVATEQTQSSGEGTEDQGPTGLVFSGGGGFEVAGVPSTFVFATLEGTLLGWSADQADPSEATVIVDHSRDGTSYTGLAIHRTNDTTARLYAANFAQGTVDVYDQDFAPVDLGASAFIDQNLPQHYSPFGIHQIGGIIYVAYAERDPATGNEVVGPGRGAIDSYRTDGSLRRRVALGLPLNAPWAVVRAPGDLTHFGDSLLIGSFGDGRITAYDVDTYELLGQLQRPSGDRIGIDGLWSLELRRDAQTNYAPMLYFTAGPMDETQGRFGRIFHE